MTRFFGVPVLGAVVVLVVVASFSSHVGSPQPEPAEVTAPIPPPTVPSDTGISPTASPESFHRSRGPTPPQKFEEPGPAPPPRVAVVIDDLGWDRSSVSIYEQIRAPLTMALLPGRPHSDWIYERWLDRYEFLIHLPMEPVDYPRDDPGKLALMTSMTNREVTRRVSRLIQRYPEAVGVNNHMGSAFTQHSEGMNALMEVLARRDMIFLDSLTTPRSVGRKVARKWGVPSLKNNVFLDRSRGREAIRGQFEKLVQRARRRGYAVGIGHFQSLETARVLRKQIPRFQRRGVEFLSLSDLVRAVSKRGPSGPPDRGLGSSVSK